MTTTPTTSLTRAERLGLAAAALRGVLAGTARAVTTWLLDQQIHPLTPPRARARAAPIRPRARPGQQTTSRAI